MGTSKAYSAPTGGSWTDSKLNLTAYIADPAPDDNDRSNVVSSFMRAIDIGVNSPIGRSGTVSNQSRGGGANQRRESASRTATKLAELGSNRLALSAVVAGLNAMPTEQAKEIVRERILKSIADAVDVLSDVHSRSALDDLIVELIEDCQTGDEIERVITDALSPENLGETLPMFFGYFIYEEFCGAYRETIRSRVDLDKCYRILNEIREFIREVVARNPFSPASGVGTQLEIREYVRSVLDYTAGIFELAQ